MESLIQVALEALQLRDSQAIHALILLIVAIMAYLVYRDIKKGKKLSAAISFVIGSGLLWFYFAVEELPGQLVSMTPYIATPETTWSTPNVIVATA